MLAQTGSDYLVESVCSSNKACCTCRGCAEAKATCTARCQACGRVLMQGEAFHISKALTSCGHDGCTGCVKSKAALTEFPALELIESWQDVKRGCL